MSLHQIIYTSCMRGINGVNDGQQIFSYDASFNDVNNTEVKSLFSYQPPTLETGVIMTEEIATTLPKSFTYRRLDNGDCAIALSTYLGRDYMGSAGRFGNHLSHVILADESEINNYPCEYYGSRLLRDHMEFDEVNNPNKPDYLPEPILERGFTVDIDTVIDFLSINNRMEIFKNMLYAVLAFESERKRVVICDEPENIIMWIAAIEYTLPLKTAININFTTYDFDPSLSSSQICGVIPRGSRYTAESQRLHFVFDLYQMNCVEFNKDEHFFDFIDTSMAFSYDSLQDFHRFITEGYTYTEANEKMYAAYRLYTVLSDGVLGNELRELNSAFDFATKYANEDGRIRICNSLISQKDFLMQTTSEVFLCVINYLLSYNCDSNCNFNDSVKTMLVDKIILEFLYPNRNKDSFLSFYNKVNSICCTKKINLTSELMKETNRNNLLNVVKEDAETWKIAFIVKIMSTFAKEQKMSINEISLESSLGQIYYRLVQMVCLQDSQKVFFLISCILDEFSFECNYLVNMALNLEGMLLDLPNGNQETVSMWKYFGQVMIKHQNDNLKIAYDVLTEYQRYDLIYMLYSLSMTEASNVSEKQRLFTEHYKTILASNEEYASQYGETILITYYEILDRSDKDVTHKAMVELLNIITTSKKYVPFAENLVETIVKAIPFGSLSKENSKIVQSSLEYLYNDLCKPITGKLLLLVIAMAIEDCKRITQFHDALNTIENLMCSQKADMTRLSETSAERYFEWILPTVCEICNSNCDLKRFYNLYNMTGNIASLFFVFSTKMYIKIGKEEKKYDAFCELMSLAFEQGNLQIREEIGKVLCKLNKQRISDLNDAMKVICQENKVYRDYWNEIKDIAESTNPILNRLSNLFRRKKD